ncbi:hypothetical protein [Shewanella saliphila]|uniref:Uncharacterized protein n=1 Tax=Shewanella saliphila TaxID=2282698 RepID=A0ABQ2QCX3_9GAMM|nr:hypothetical protein [Shewanella saliphila]MCL1103343.1 hypothetical protein [Shewanella saliphila]GGP68811.1 hypothetical protein GCM10009409_37120 [Shewanella saliphila]
MKGANEKAVAESEIKGINSKKVDKSVDSLNWVLKLFGLMTLVSALFGVGYQKGVILAMGLGNISGNYEVREVFNSAVLGYIHLMSKLGIDNYWGSLADRLNAILFHSPFLIIIALLSVIIASMYFRSARVRVAVNKVKRTSQRLAKRVWIKSSLIVIGLVSSFTVFMAAGVTLAHLIPMLVAVLLLPTLIGYMAGNDYIKQSMSGDVCVVATAKMLKEEHIRQCTQILINGNKIMGEIVLENASGYYIHRNRSFVYVAKDGKSCLYSIFEKSDIAKTAEDFSFEDEGLSSFCGAGASSGAQSIQTQ